MTSARSIFVLLGGTLGLALPLIAEGGAAPPRTESVEAPTGSSAVETKISLSPGDWLKVDAAGYVNDATCSPTAEKQGLIFIPGVTGHFVPIADVRGQMLHMPATVTFGRPLRVWLAYGSYYHNTAEIPKEVSSMRIPCSTADQRPTVTVTFLERPNEPRGPAPFDLLYAAYDANGLPLNPRWGSPYPPDACRTACGGFVAVRQRDGTRQLTQLSEDCTHQHPYLDVGDCQFDLGKCPLPRDLGGGASHLSGHIEWGPATFYGKLSTLGGKRLVVNPDGDIELFLVPDGGAGVTAQTGLHAGRLGVEFSSAETIKWFQTKWWRRFPYHRSSYYPLEFLAPFLRHWHDGKRDAPALEGRDATVIGIFGLDNEHDAHAELHPVYAMAIRTPEFDESSDVWQVFARTWGTGGSCGDRINHTIDPTEIRIPLKGGRGGIYGTGEATLLDHGSPVTDWKVYSAEENPVLVLKPRSPCGVVEGQLTLRPSRGAATEVGAGDKHVVLGEPPPAEPVRLELARGSGHLCTRSPIPSSKARWQPTM